MNLNFAAKVYLNSFRKSRPFERASLTTEIFRKVGFTESFNISVSVAILLNTLRKRLVDSDIEWKLSQEEQTDLKIEWCKKILRRGQAPENEYNEQLLKKDL